MNINKLFLQHGNNMPLYKNFYIKHPKLIDIVELQGTEKDLYSSYISVLTSTSLDIADILWVEQQIWYEDIKNEWLFFIEKACIESKEITFYKKNIDKDNDNIKSIPNKSILINDDFCKAIGFFTDVSTDYIVYNTDDNMVLLSVNKDSDGFYYYTDNSFMFTEYCYNICKQFLSKINWIDNKDYDVIHGGTKYAKKYILQNEYNCRMDDLKRHKPPLITLDSITSSLMAKGISPKEIWDLPIYLIYNLYYRYIQFESWNGTTQALYNGCVDTKKHPINWEKINWSKIID